MAENDISDALTGRALDTVDTVVATVNDKAVRPAIVAARGIVFGVVISVIGITVVVLFCVMFIRLTTIAGHRIWASYLVLGLLFCGAGALLYSRAACRPTLDGPMPERRKVVIIGSGPAGLTAALYSARAQLEPLVIEGEPSSTSDQPGGQLMLTTDVENYPGFVDGVMGPELMGMMRAQALRFEAELRTAKVSRIEVAPWPFEVWVGDPEADEPTVLADTLIVATGARALMLGVPNEDRLLGYGVSTCATCDGFFFREQHIAVAGGGDSALEEALFLTRFGSKVTVIHRRDELRASKIMQQRAFANPKIDFAWNSVVTDILGDTKVSGLRPARHRQRRGRPSSMRPGSSSPSATSPTVPCSRASSSWRTTATSRRSAGPPAPASTGSSPAATCRTTTTARPSPPPARAAWPPSTPSAGWRSGASRSGTEPGAGGVAPVTRRVDERACRDPERRYL